MKLLLTTQIVDKNDPILGFFHAWVEEFAKHFDHVHVICLKKGHYDLPPNVTVYSLGKEGGESTFKYVWRFYYFFYTIFFSERVDVVFYHMGAVYNILAVPFFLFRTHYKTKFYWWKTHGKLNLVGKIASLFVDEIVTAGVKSFAMPSKKVRVVGHAIDTNLFTLQTQREHSSALRLLSVGRISPIKKNDITVQICARFKRVWNDEAVLHMYGPVDDVAYKKIVDEMIVKEHMEGNIQFCGEVNQATLPSIYHAHDVLVHPAYEAGFDKVVLEAMSTGVIPITSVESFKPILEPYGLYVPPRDYDGYITVLQRIATMPDDERDSLASKLHNEVSTKHSITTLSKRIFG